MAYNYMYRGQEEDTSCQYQNMYEIRQPQVILDQPLFTPQELYAFEPVQQNIANSMEMVQDEGMWSQTGCWDQEAVMMKQMEAESYGLDGGFYGEHSQACSPELGFAAQPDMLAFQQEQCSQPVSPVTPAESPLQHYAGNITFNNNNNMSVPSAFLLVPTASNGQFQQYSAYQVPMGPIPVSAESYIGPVTVPHCETPQHPSPYTIPSSAPSPMAEPPALDKDDVLPNHGNTELLGMGLYDDPPDLLYACPSTPGGCSPVTPHDQLRPTLGKGLVLEKSFGLPEEMMMKDEESGQIFKGKLRLDDDEEDHLGSSSSPRIYGEQDMALDVY